MAHFQGWTNSLKKVSVTSLDNIISKSVHLEYTFTDFSFI